MLRSFDHVSKRLLGRLSALGMTHLSALIAKRYGDTAFKQIIVYYGYERYWREQLIALNEVGGSFWIG